MAALKKGFSGDEIRRVLCSTTPARLVDVDVRNPSDTDVAKLKSVLRHVVLWNPSRVSPPGTLAKAFCSLDDEHGKKLSRAGHSVTRHTRKHERSEQSDPYTTCAHIMCFHSVLRL